MSFVITKADKTLAGLCLWLVIRIIALMWALCRLCLYMSKCTSSHIVTSEWTEYSVESYAKWDEAEVWTELS